MKDFNKSKSNGPCPRVIVKYGGINTDASVHV